MMPSNRSIFFALFALILATTGQAEEKYGLAADNKIYAQTLVNRVFATHAALLTSVGIHTTAPGAANDDYKIIASTLDIIGKKSDPNDMDIVTFERTMITPIPTQSRLGVMLPLQDQSGKVIASLALSFKYHTGDDQVKALAAATVIRDDLAKEISSVADLFKAAR